MTRAPITIKFMLVCYTSPLPAEEIGENEWNSPAGREATEWLFEKGLVEGSSRNSLRATEKGEAWVKFICETPLPVQKWELPKGEEE
jgi:hypothetical protein